MRSYSRHFPAIFSRASGAEIHDTEGRAYIDFFCGAGALGYGHNEPHMKAAVIEYLSRDGVVHSLDMATEARNDFLGAFAEVVLDPRAYDYRVQFTGPTGANAVEAALKLAKKCTGRRGIVAFTGAYHGLSAGALSVTAHGAFRGAAYLMDAPVHFHPYEGYRPGVDSIDLLGELLSDENSGLDTPAAVIVEVVQAEGGVNVASDIWLRQLQDLCRAHGILLIADEIQTGCGRTGPFFGFERAGLRPDMVVLSKSISGYGFPMSVLLIQPEHDKWAQGEHNGTFRGNNVAFVTATVALSLWRDGHLRGNCETRSSTAMTLLADLAGRYPSLLRAVRGCGLMIGVECTSGDVAERIVRGCFDARLLVERCGRLGATIKLLPPVNIASDTLNDGVGRFESAVNQVAVTLARL